MEKLLPGRGRGVRQCLEYSSRQTWTPTSSLTTVRLPLQEMVVLLLTSGSSCTISDAQVRRTLERSTSSLNHTRQTPECQVKEVIFRGAAGLPAPSCCHLLWH